MAICGNCFNNIASGSICRICGFNNEENTRIYPIALPTGTILRNQYFIGRVLGQGGFGITYLAQDNRTKERLAIKEYFPTEFVGRSQGALTVQPHSTLIGDGLETGKQQFLDEARTLAEFIGDPHIVQVYRYFTENDTAYFVMEFVDGDPLNKYMMKLNRLLTEEEADALFIPLMDSLEKVHQKGIVHRDISPDNIIINEEGSGKLIDFGAARYSTGEMSKSLDVILKHGFAPPEQYARRGRRGAFTDVYSLAATYYFAITGKVPPDSINRIVEDELIPPSELGIKISKKKEAVLMKAMAPNYKDRYQTMAEFRREMGTAPTVTLPAAGQKTKDAKITKEKDIQFNQPGSSGNPENTEAKAETDQVFTPLEEKKKASSKKWKHLFWIIPLAAILAFAVITWMNVNQLQQLVADHQFLEAKDMSFARSVAAIKDKNLNDYIDAGVLLEEGNYDEAEVKFTSLYELQYRDSGTMCNEVIYQNGLNLAENKDWNKALSQMNRLARIQYKDSEDQVNAITFAQAKDLLETKGKEISGYIKIKRLADKNYEEAKNELTTAKEKTYTALVRDYKADELTDFDSYKKYLKGYKDADKYFALVSVKNKVYNTFMESDFKLLFANIDFEDTKEALVSRHGIANRFLAGKWKTSDGRYYLEIDMETGSSYNIPKGTNGNRYKIENGKYLNYNEGDEDNKRVAWEISIVSEDIIKIYSHQNGQTYTLYRQ